MKFLVCFLFLLQFVYVNCQTIYYARYNNLGCWNDKSTRAIPTLEGSSPILDGSYQSRANSILKCARVSNTNGYEVFAIQHGGWCASSVAAESTYEQYGKSSKCSSDGKGGPYANQVYELTYLAKVTLQSLGCWTDISNRAVRTLEGLDSILDGNYQTRANAIEKCARAALARSYKVIAIQDGGWCAGSRYAVNTYKKYGPSSSCNPGGKGGPWANNVYRLNTVWEKKFPTP